MGILFSQKMSEKEKEEPANRHLFNFVPILFLSPGPPCLLLKFLCYLSSLQSVLFTSEEIVFLPGLVILFISRLYFLRMATIDQIRFCDNVTVPFFIELHRCLSLLCRFRIWGAFFSGLGPSFYLSRKRNCF